TPGFIQHSEMPAVCLGALTAACVAQKRRSGSYGASTWLLGVPKSIVHLRELVYGSQSGRSDACGLPVRAKAIHASCICAESVSTRDPAGTRSRASGASRVPKTNGTSTVSRAQTSIPGRGLPREHIRIRLRRVSGVQLSEPHHRHPVPAVTHDRKPQLWCCRALTPSSPCLAVHHDRLDGIELYIVPGLGVHSRIGEPRQQAFVGQLVRFRAQAAIELLLVQVVPTRSGMPAVLRSAMAARASAGMSVPSATGR